MRSAFSAPTTMLIGLVTLTAVAACLAGPATGSATAGSAALAVPPGPVVARVFFTDRAELATLAERLDIWEVHHDRSMIVAQLTPADLSELIQRGLRIEIDEERSAQLGMLHQSLPGQVAGIPGYPCYRSVEETQAALVSLESAYPALVRLVDIGDSWEKVMPGGAAGHDIWAIVVSNKATPGPKPRFFLMAEIHAREYATAEIATRFAELVVQSYGTDPDVTWLVDHFELHVVPMSNPDGRKYAEQGYSWRKNTDNDDGCTAFPNYGTDLNRNHSFYWNQGGSSGNPCDNTYRGPFAASEPEVQAIESYLASIYTDERGPGDNDPVPPDTSGILITLHSYSELVLWPWGFTTNPAPNGVQLQTLGRKLAYFNNYDPGQSVSLYPTTGSTDDWAYGVLGVASYTFEVGTAFFQSCSSFESTVYPTNRDALLYAFKAARRPYQSPAGPEVMNLSVNPPVVLHGGVATLAATVNDTLFRTGSGEPSQAINEARLLIDGPSWVDGVASVPMEPTDGSFNQPVEGVQAIVATGGMTAGRHLLFVEGRDAAGNWGVPTAAFLCVATGAQAVSVEPAAERHDVAAGATVPYTLAVTNTGATSETFLIAVSGNLWSTTAPVSVGPLAPCSSATFAVMVTVPSGAASCATDIATLTVSSPGATGSAVLTTVVDALQGAQITAPAAVCAQSAGNVVSVPDQGAGATYDWTVIGGTLIAGDGTSSISFTAGSASSIVLQVAVGHPAGCSITRTREVVVRPLPTPTVSGMTALCVGANLTLHASGGPFVSYLWHHNGEPIPSATGATFTRASAALADQGSYAVLVSDDNGCSVMSPAVEVTLAVEPLMSIADVTLIEGNSGATNAVFSVTLSANYCIDVAVDYSTLADTATANVDFTPVAGSFVFTPGQVTKTIAVPVIGDFVDEEDEAFRVTLTNAVHAMLARGEAVGTIRDDDTAGFVVTPASGLITTESGGTATFNLKLGSQPLASVGTTLAANDPTEGAAGPATLSFTTANWSAPQTVTVRGIDDSILDGDIPYQVVFTPVVSADSLYSGMLPPEVGVTNQDNDAAQIVVTPSTGLVTTEKGGTARFVMVPRYEPYEPVTVTLSSSQPTEGTVAPSSITFQPASWGHPRVVTVTGVSDAILDGNKPFTIITSPATSADPRYLGVDPPDVSVVNIDSIGGASEARRLDLDLRAGPGTSSNLNGILEPGESVQVEPVWHNSRITTQTLSGTIAGFAGPGVGYFLADSSASYGSIPAGGTGSCATSGNCYAISTIEPASRPSLHWDARFSETLSDGTTTAWIVHVGDSFLDVGVGHWAYTFIETLLHAGVTTGCSPAARLYCPAESVTRAQMAAFIARAMASGDENVLATGSIAGKGSFDCSLGGSSLFVDVPPSEWYCRHAHHLLAFGVTTGCNPVTGEYCPGDAVTRGPMAVFMARAMAGGDAEVPWAHVEPATGRSYDCSVAGGSHFSDVLHADWYCRHVNYLWARDVIGGCNPAAGLYCPLSFVSREQMSKFLTNAFALTLF